MGKLWEKLFGRNKAPAEPEQKPEVPSVRALPYWTSDRAMERAGDGGSVSYPGYSCRTVRIRWVGHERDESGRPRSVREPRPETREMPREDFTAAGRHYTAFNQLAETWCDDGSSWNWSRDIHGRRALYFAEPFPCFDESDYLYEDRYYRWFFLWEDGKLTRVQATDKMPNVTVTEDVADIEAKWYKKLSQLGCFQ